MKAAEACYLESEYLDSGAIVATISRFLAEERDRQIEAAPELLEVAKRILDRGYVSASIEEERGDHLALVAAISKAEGRA